MTNIRQQLRQDALDYHRRMQRDRLLNEIATATGELLSSVPETRAATVNVSADKLAYIRALIEQLEAC